MTSTFSVDIISFCLKRFFLLKIILDKIDLSSKTLLQCQTIFSTFLVGSLLYLRTSSRNFICSRPCLFVLFVWSRAISSVFFPKHRVFFSTFFLRPPFSVKTFFRQLFSLRQTTWKRHFLSAISFTWLLDARTHGKLRHTNSCSHFKYIRQSRYVSLLLRRLPNFFGFFTKDEEASRTLIRKKIFFLSIFIVVFSSSG